MKKKRRIRYIVLLLLAVMLICIVWSYFSVRGTSIPKRDGLEKTNRKESNLIKTKNTIDYQINNDCSGYAIAYVLRSLGQTAEGPIIYKEELQKKDDGSVILSEVVKCLRKKGCKTTLFTGTIDSLEARVDLGIPVIVFIKANEISDIYHYTCVVGYDGEYLYLADSVLAFSNISTSNYNRRIEIEQFKKLWKIDRMGSNNLYIAVER